MFCRTKLTTADGGYGWHGAHATSTSVPCAAGSVQLGPHLNLHCAELSESAIVSQKCVGTSVEVLRLQTVTKEGSFGSAAKRASVGMSHNCNALLL